MGTTPYSALTHLECSACGERHDADILQTTCRQCGLVLFARYDLDAVRRSLSPEALAGRPATLWRYHELLPVRNADRVTSLGEGYTPLLPAQRLGPALGCRDLYVKDEGLNPTGTFKARGLAMAVARAAELGASALAIPTAGNAGGAMAAYAAAAGLAAHVFMPVDAPEATKRECRHYGAQLTLVDGLIGDAGSVVRARAADAGWFDVSTLREPYRAEGKKTMGYELAEQLGWQVPDVIVYPTGGGTGIVGMWKAFAELEALGWIGSKRPRMVVVQAEGCAPMVRAFHQGATTAEPWEDAQTIAGGMRVPSAIGDYLILQALYESGGAAVAVSDDELLAAMGELARTEGISACPEGAATLAGLLRLLASGAVSGDESVVLFNTGSGLKYQGLLPAADDVPVVLPPAD
ncbi:MAG: threonine synthase [Dehalococcoidia bacterium]|nr:threonine synthase [Dehalococcoidia bacterium]